MKEHEMGGTCSRHGRGEKCIQSIRRKRALGSLGVDGSILLKWMLKIYDVRVDWIQLAEDWV
jgi:hypothetical protein